MSPVDIGRLRSALVQETRGQYIGGVDPHTFVESFMKWNPDIDTSFKAEKPSEARLRRLIGMAGKPGSAMNEDWQGAFSGWPLVCGRKGIQRLDFEDTHSCRDAESQLGPDSCNYLRNKPIVPRLARRKIDFANIQSFTEHKADAKMDAFVDAGGEEYDGEAYYVMAGYSKRQESVEEDEKEDEDAGMAATEDAYIAEPSAADVDTEGAEAHPKVTDDTKPTPGEKYPFENDTKQGRSTRGQIASYAGVTMAMQFRSHLFSVLVCGRYARFIRWDRSCAIVTRRFDYTTHPLILFDFYKRFAQLTDVQRGLYPNLRELSRPAGMEALEMIRKYATSYFTGEHADFYKKESDPKQLPLLSLVFGDDTYVVPAPCFNGRMYSPFGRCTRNRAVVLLKGRNSARVAEDGTYGRDGQILYFKEYWREESAFTKKESEVYRMLEAAKVTFVAEMHAGGDFMVGDDTDAKAIATIGHEWKLRPWVQKHSKLRIRRLTAHFIVLSTLGRELATFRTARQLVTCIADAMDAHQQAYKLGILHRDVSAGNILMTLEPKNRRGFLIDWDHCIFLNEALKERTDTRVHRTGTWQFMSAYLTQNPESASHTVVDDRESALHVLTSMALKHLRHNVGNQQRLRGLLAVFDSYVPKDGKPDVGTDDKRSMLCAGGPAVQFAIPAIKILIRILAKFFSPRYTHKYDWTAEELQLMSPEALAEYEKEKDEHRQKLAKLLDPPPDFVYETMRSWAAKMPEPPDNITQWVDNLKGHGGLLDHTGDQLVSGREKMSLRWDGLVSYTTGNTGPSTSSD
ncbi:hypothetical protein PTI98_002146 [Pleurotus ostreatus]|nr:hypothetical protein PTI98_002146 [Pleurotus ostreatus]